jgi:hypothetical protein
MARGGARGALMTAWGGFCAAGSGASGVVALVAAPSFKRMGEAVRLCPQVDSTTQKRRRFPSASPFALPCLALPCHDRERSRQCLSTGGE